MAVLLKKLVDVGFLCWVWMLSMSLMSKGAALFEADCLLSRHRHWFEFTD